MNFKRVGMMVLICITMSIMFPTLPFKVVKAESNFAVYTEVDEIVSGLQLKKLKEIGMIVEKQANEDQPITRIEFMSLINDAYGFVKTEKFKHLSNETT